MLLRTRLAALALTQATPDTVPLPPLDTAWSRLDTVEDTASGPVRDLSVWVFVDRWGRVGETRVEDDSLDELTIRSAERAASELRFVPEGQLPGWARLQLPTVVAPPSRRARRSDESVFDTRKPEIVDREGASRLVLQYWPAALRRADIGGEVIVWVFVDRDGTVRNVRIKEGTGERGLDEAAERDDEPKSAKVSGWLVFQREQGLIPAVAPAACAAPRELTEAPQFSPVDVVPELVTPTWEMKRIIEDYWPQALQKKGNRFPLRLWYLIDERGRVCKTQFLQAPSDPYIAAKAEQLAKRLRFTVALRGGTPVAAWRQRILDLKF